MAELNAISEYYYCLSDYSTALRTHGFAGAWREDRFEGWGRVRYADNSEFEGDMRQGERHGHVRILRVSVLPARVCLRACVPVVALCCAIFAAASCVQKDFFPTIPLFFFFLSLLPHFFSRYRASCSITWSFLGSVTKTTTSQMPPLPPPPLRPHRLRKP